MLTPIEIDNKTFKKTKFSGYDINDVEEFLVLVMEDYEKLYKENAELKDKVNTMQDSISYYKSVEEGISKTVENAQVEAEAIKQRAVKEAEDIRSNAHTTSAKGIDELKYEIQRVEMALEGKRKQMQVYKIRVSSMLEAQLKILNEDEDM